MRSNHGENPTGCSGVSFLWTNPYCSKFAGSQKGKNGQDYCCSQLSQLVWCPKIGDGCSVGLHQIASTCGRVLPHGWFRTPASSHMIPIDSQCFSHFACRMTLLQIAKPRQQLCHMIQLRSSFER